MISRQKTPVAKCNATMPFPAKKNCPSTPVPTGCPAPPPPPQQSVRAKKERGQNQVKTCEEGETKMRELQFDTSNVVSLSHIIAL